MYWFLVIVPFFATCSRAFQPIHSKLITRKHWGFPDKKHVICTLSNSLDRESSIPERGLRRIDLDTDDIVRESAGVIEPTDKPKSTAWGFHVKGPKATSGHLLEKNEPLWDNLERHHEKWEQKVEVHDIKDIDPVTVTALLFAALAINFIIFAHWGDAGLGGLVARFINHTS